MKKVIVLIAVLGLMGGGWYAHNQFHTETLGNQELTLYGNIEIHQVELGFRVSGRIVDMGVQEGDAVRAGDVLARLDARPYEDELRMARATVAMQEAALAKLKAGYRPQEVEQARATLDEAQATAENMRRNYERLQSLRRSRSIAQQDLENGAARYHEAKARLDAAQNQLEMLAQGYRTEDVIQQSAAVEAAKASQAKAQTALDDTVLAAPETGVVLSRAREKGAIVLAGQTVYTVTLINPTYIRAYVSQPQLGLVRPGAAVTIEIDAMPGKKYPGTVGFISSTAEFTPKSVETREVRNDLVFRLRILADDSDNVFRQGMPVTVTIPLAREDDRGAS